MSIVYNYEPQHKKYAFRDTHPAKIQINLCIHTVLSVFGVSLKKHWLSKMFFGALNEDPDQTAQTDVFLRWKLMAEDILLPVEAYCTLGDLLVKTFYFQMVKIPFGTFIPDAPWVQHISVCVCVGGGDLTTMFTQRIQADKLKQTMLL